MTATTPTVIIPPGMEDVIEGCLAAEAVTPAMIATTLIAYGFVISGQSLEDMEQEVFEVNTANGWFEDDRTVGDDLALLHSEVSEGLEAFRSWQLEDVTVYECKKHDHSHPMTAEQLAIGPCKPEGFGSEMADVLVRLLDTCRRRGINLRWEYERKIAFNRTRGHKHGGRAL